LDTTIIFVHLSIHEYNYMCKMNEIYTFSLSNTTSMVCQVPCLSPSCLYS